MYLHTRNLAVGAMIAALYTVLTVALAPISYGAVQIRVSEALVLLPAYSIAGVWGVGVGCLLSNIIGLAMGANILGGMDILFGTVATVLAALLSRALRGVRVRGLPVLSALPPVILNALIVGGELAFATLPAGSGWTGFLAMAAWVGLGELIACVGFGLPLCWALQKTGLAGRLFAPPAMGNRRRAIGQ